MAAITKAFTAIADSAVDPDSPVDTALVTALRDNTTHLREWLGASFYAGAAQDHAHDGVTSALVEIGPNLLRNGSFESGESGWTFTDYSGGSHAISATEYIHGVKSLAIASTVLANGGGTAESNEYIPVGGSQFLSFEIWRWASVANISSKCEAVWYDNAKAQISVTAAYSDTNTPTAKTLVQTGLQAPSTARYARLRVTGGVPGTGTATGTIYFDGGMIGRTYIVEPLIGPAAVTQSKLKTTTGSTSLSAGGGTTNGQNYILPGGEYNFFPTTKFMTSGDGTVDTAHLYPSTDYAAYFHMYVDGGSTGTTTYYLQVRYVQACPPYNLGDGDIPLFIFARIMADGSVPCTWIAQDPPWANNGPTVIRPDYINGSGMEFKRLKRIVAEHKTAEAARLALGLDKFLERMATDPLEMVEITQALKQADMQLIPHPFGKLRINGHVTPAPVVLISPLGALCERLRDLNDAGESISDLIHGGHLILDNTRMNVSAPPGVMAVRARWKLTRS